MFNVEDYAVHLVTGCIGKVIGYGHQMIDGAYLPTLKVRVTQGTETTVGSFVEDIHSAWQELKETYDVESLDRTQRLELQKSKTAA